MMKNSSFGSIFVTLLAWFGAAVVIFLILFTIDYSDLECSNANRLCSVYKQTGIFGKNRYLDKTFKIDDITGYNVQKSCGNRSGCCYWLELGFKNDPFDRYYTEFDTKSEARAKEILFSGILGTPNYKLKGSVFKSLFCRY